MALARATHILRANLETVAKEQFHPNPEIEISTVTTAGANFTSFLFEATIKSKDKDDLDLFAKVAAVGKKMRSQAPIRVFEIEAIFYTQLVNKYRELEDKHGVPKQHRLKVPKMYACCPTLYEETVVLENLTSQGYTLHNRLASVDWDYAAASFTELAKLHAMSMALKHEKPEEFERFLKDFRFELPVSGGDMQQFLENMIKATLEATREENKGKLMAFISQFTAGGMEAFLKFYLPGDSPVIRHGDFRPSNLMHKVREDGSLDVIPVDYQTLQPGTPVIDLLYFIFLGTDQTFREKHYDKLLDHYYTELSAALSRVGLDAEETYSRQKFDDDIKENLTYGIILSLTTLSLVCVESADAPEVNGEMDMSSFMSMKQGSMYADRLNGILDDFVKWGIL